MPAVTWRSVCPNRAFLQRSLGKLLWRQRETGQRKDNPMMRDFGYNDNIIRNQKFFVPVAATNRKQDEREYM